MYIKILLTIITACQVYNFFKGFFIYKVIYRYSKEVMPKLEKAFRSLGLSEPEPNPDQKNFGFKN